MSIARIIDNIFYFYYILILLRIFLTWVPSIDWYQQPLKTIREITDVYLDIFRKFIPPIGGLDISPIIALIALGFIKGFIVGIVSMFVG